MKHKIKVPVIDIFAGPGGLGDGFATYQGSQIEFDVKASVEMTKAACETLRYRKAFLMGQANSDIEVLNRLRARRTVAYSKRASVLSDIPEAAVNELNNRVFEAELGEGSTTNDVLASIRKSHKTTDCVLIGGPPCQAYSLAGRAKNQSNPNYSATADKRNFLYREYLEVLSNVRPTVFVMENVRGMLSAIVDGQKVFPIVLRDLADPGNATGHTNSPKYRIYSLVSDGEVGDLDHKDYLVKAEEYGIPQARHRVILLGVRTDIDKKPVPLKKQNPVSIGQAIGSLPVIGPRLSREKDNKRVFEVLKLNAQKLRHEAVLGNLTRLADELERVCEHDFTSLTINDNELVMDSKGFFDHISRPHMAEDLMRYLYVSASARANAVAPTARQFYFDCLTPKHQNWESGNFVDRFKSTVRGKPSNTITSHISKDGNSFIHYDPLQCRSLTVREAARIQTFDDNYFFEGSRTHQYHQVGNAVPTKLSRQIAQIVENLLT